MSFPVVIPINLTAEHVEATAAFYLSARYDNPQPTPDFHRECWDLYCSSAKAVAVAAPRGHAKSTALTHDYIISAVVYRAETYIIIVGASEEKACEHLNDIATEFRENEELCRDFKIKGFLRDKTTDIILECTDGHQFRIMARGSEQKIRGTKWRGRRPGLIVCDDLEDDEQVENKDRRVKFRKWFFRACKQSLRRGGKIRVHGTVLHIDSLLNRLMKNKSWKCRKYKAHKSFQDFSEILWPGQFDEKSLREVRQEFINEGDQGGYSQEYLNDPQDNDDKYLRSEWFREMQGDDKDVFKIYGVGVDFALSKQDHANRTSFTVGGRDTKGKKYIVDNRSGRWDSLEIIELFFDIQSAWSPDSFYVENGKEWLAIKPILEKEMIEREIFMNFVEMTPIKDKKIRGRSFQKQMKAGVCKFDTMASWYDDYKEVLLLFTGNSEAMQDDEFDSTATLFMGWEEDANVDEEDEMTDEELDDQMELARISAGGDGRSEVTGY